MGTGYVALPQSRDISQITREIIAMWGFAHLKIVILIIAAVVLYALSDTYRVPIDGVLLFVAIGAVLACAWDKLTSITA